MLRLVSDHPKTNKMRKNADNKLLFVIKYFSNCYFYTSYVSNCYKNQENV